MTSARLTAGIWTLKSKEVEDAEGTYPVRDDSIRGVIIAEELRTPGRRAL